MHSQLEALPLLRGELTRLVAADAEKDVAGLRAWSRDAEFLRLYGSNPARPWTEAGVKKELESAQGQDQPNAGIFPFLIRALPGDPLIGLAELYIDSWAHREAWVAIGLGQRDYWGQGYGTDAMRLLLRYAFQELNLWRVSLGVFGYNERARRSYEKCGFVVEGAIRDRLQRDGRRWDMIIMGLLRAEWEKVSQ
jgi:RimJ/RimL family protein N-acetyltransferase